MLKVLLAQFILVTLFFSCSPEEATGVNSSFGISTTEQVANVVINNSSAVNVQDATPFFVAEKVTIDAETAFKIGDGVTDFFKVDSQYILVNLGTLTITSINVTGTLKWQMKSEYGNPFGYTNMFCVTYNKFKNVIEVYDNADYKIVSFSTDGEFIEKHPVTHRFMDRIALDKDHVVYDLRFNPPGYLNASGVPYAYGISPNDQDITLICPNEAINVNSQPFVTIDNFYYFQGDLLQHPTFLDTIFIFEGNKPRPYFVTKFASNGKSQKVYEDANVFKTAKLIYQEGIRFVRQAVMHGSQPVVLYTNNLKPCLYLSSDGQSEDLNAFYLKIGDDIIKTPYIMRDGVFMTYQYESHRKRIEERTKSGTDFGGLDPTKEDLVYPDSESEPVTFYFLTLKTQLA